jgi:ribosome maturation factor RimP
MDQVSLVERIVEPSLNAMGYDLVRVQITGGENMTLQIMAERRDGEEMTVEDCADISRNVSAVMDIEDPVPDAYTLEVSSPGMDRPLVKITDFSRFTGFEVRIDTRLPVIDRKRFRGRLGRVEGDTVHIEIDGEIYAIPFDDIVRAKLALTDELIDISQRAHKDKQKKENA